MSHNEFGRPIRPLCFTPEQDRLLALGYPHLIQLVDGHPDAKKAEKHARDSQMSIDIYFERDIENGMLTESQAQESINDFVIKLRVARFLRTREYDEQREGGCSQVCDPAC